jgi:hypothetical protein
MAGKRSKYGVTSRRNHNSGFQSKGSYVSEREMKRELLQEQPVRREPERWKNGGHSVKFDLDLLLP